MRFLLALCCALALQAQNHQTESSLVGTWKLSANLQMTKAGVTRPNPALGGHEAGYMIYTDAGIMCSLFLGLDRPKWADAEQPSDAEVRSAMNGMGSYCGTYDVDAAEPIVNHHVLMDRVPNATGSVRRRRFTIENNHLVLHIDARELGPDLIDSTVEWDRMPDSSRTPVTGLWKSKDGFLMFTHSGVMCTHVYTLERPRYAAPRPTEAELRVAMNGFSAACGPYEISGAKITQRVELEKIPNHIGTSRTWAYQLDGRALTLDGKRWERAGN